MNRIFEIVLASLRSVLCADERALNNIGVLDENTLKEAYKLSKKHDMAHLVGYALDREYLLDAFPELKEKFAKEQYLAVYRYENIKYETERICSLFDEEKIPYIKLKGAVIRELYPEPWMRTSCDIDILVHEEDLDRAIEALIGKLSYRKDGEKKYHDVWLYSESGVHLELHFNIKETIHQLDRVLDRVWEYAEDAKDSQLVLTDEFLIYHVIAHTAYHFVGGGCGIRPFADIYFLRKKLEYNENTVLELCRESGIEEFYSSANALTSAWFEGDEKNALTSEMEEYILGGGVYGSESSKIAAKRESKGGKVKYAVSRIFAPYEILKQRYPKLKSRAMIPVYQVKRWFDVVYEGRAKNAARELKINNDLSQDKIESVQKLMRELRLDKHIK